MLQNDETYLLLKQLNVNVAKRQKVSVAKRDATQALKETPAPEALGNAENPAQDSSALTGGSELVSKSVPHGENPDEQKQPLPALEQKQHQDPNRPARIEGRVLPCSGAYCSEADVRGHLRDCFPAFRDAEPSARELEMMLEVVAKCDENCCFPSELMAFARKHKRDGLVPRTVKALHKAVCGEGVSTTNSLLRQHKEHIPADCWICKAELKGRSCERCGKRPVVFEAGVGEARWCADCLKLPSHRRDRQGYLTAAGGAKVV